MSRLLTSTGVRRSACLLIGLAGLTLSCATASPTRVSTADSVNSSGEAAPSSPLPLDPDVTTGKLANGLTYFVKPHRPDEKRAQLMLVVKAGSLQEEDDQRGLAHFVEHMAFNGTRRFEKETLVDFFEKSGLRFGSHANATTQYDRTEYSLQVPTDDPALLLTALDVIADWADGLSFDPEEVEKERLVMLSEWTSSRGVARRMGEQYRKLLLAGSRYAEREVIGDKAVLESGSRERLVEFYRRWYRPERMAVVVVGSIDPAAVREAIEQRFSPLGREAGAGASPTIDVPIGRQPVAAVVTDPEATATVANVVFKSRARRIDTEAAQREQLLSLLAAQMLSRRLDALAENPEAPFTGAGSSLSPDVFGCLDLVQVSARAKQGQAQASLERLLLELERVRRHGFVETELERTKQNFARVLAAAVEAAPTIEGSVVARGLANHYVSRSVFTSAKFDAALGSRLLAEITTADVNESARSWFTRQEELLIVSGPASDALPQEPQLLSARSAAAEQALEPYQDEVREGPLLATLPSPGRVVQQQVITELGVQIWTLSNGARVVLKPTDFKRDQIVGRAVSFGGDAVAGEADYSSARYATSLVLSSGVGALDRQALSKALTGKVVSVQPWVDEQSEGLNASASTEDVDTMFQLMHLYMTAPRRDEAAFEAMRAALREGLRTRDLNPFQVFADAVAREQWGAHPRRLPPTLASVDEIDMERALGFYTDRFSDVSDMTFVFVGDLDPERFRPLVEQYLASLPASGRTERPRDLGLHRKPGVVRVRVREGLEDKASVIQIFHGELPWSDDAHTDLVALETYLSIRLREVLREQLGGAYTPIVNSEFSRVPYDAYTLTLGFQCKTADIEKLREATRAVIAEVKEQGAGEPYLTKLINQRTRNLEESYRDNGFWLGQLAGKFQRGEDPRQILRYHELTERITRENIQRAARQFLRSDRYVDAQLAPK